MVPCYDHPLVIHSSAGLLRPAPCAPEMRTEQKRRREAAQFFQYQTRLMQQGVRPLDPWQEAAGPGWVRALVPEFWSAMEGTMEFETANLGLGGFQ